MTTYKDSGVNIQAGDDFSKYIYEQIKSTWREDTQFKVTVPSDDFSGLRCVDISGLKNTVMGINFDGVGTKVEIAERLGDFSTIGYDLVAMVCDDAIIRGAIPVVMGSIIDFNNIPEGYAEQLRLCMLIDGYVKAAKEAGVQIINGEVAELGNRVGGIGPLNLNWGAGVIWLAEKDKLISGKNIQVGEKVVLFKENGFRSNGLSLVRKIIDEDLDKARKCPDVYARTILYSVLTPSKIYTPIVKNIIGDFGQESHIHVSGMAHITGGGLPGKLGRMLKPSGLGVELNNIFFPPPIMWGFQKKGEVSDEEAYKTWNMGNGFAICTRHTKIVQDIAESYGVASIIAGEIIEEPVVRIKSKGIYDEGLKLEFKI